MYVNFTIIYLQCDRVIAQCESTRRQVQGFERNTNYKIKQLKCSYEALNYCPFKKKSKLLPISGINRDEQIFQVAL